MKVCVNEAEVLDITPSDMEKDGYYVMPCGCRFLIREDLPLVRGQHKAIEYDLDNLNLECEATYNLISSGRCKGVFQLESPLGRHWAKRLKPENMKHISALVAVLRPGCLKSKSAEGVSMTELFCRRKNGESEVSYLHPSLEPILKETYGILTYQEQAMQISRSLAGFSLQEADVLRKCVTGDTSFVSKSRGWITIDRLLSEGGYQNDSFLVMNADGKQSWKAIDKIWSTGKHDVSRVRSSSGLYVWATRYHQFLTDTGWKARSRLCVDDSLVAARSIDYEGYDRIDSDTALIVAAIVAEGQFSDTNGKRVGKFTNHDTQMMNWFLDAFELRFGTNSYWISEDRRVVSIRVEQQEQLEELINRGKSDSRRLPDVMMGMTKETTRRFLSYLLACEGGVSEAGQFEFSSKSPELANQVKLLLLRFGVKSLLGEYPETQRYRVSVNDVVDQRRLLNELTTLWPNVKRDTLDRISSTKVANFTSDTFPQTVVGRLLDQYPYAGSPESGTLYTKPISRARLTRVADRTEDPYWMNLVRASHCYEQVKSLSENQRQVVTYDFTIAGEDTPFIVANGLVIHNSIGKKDTEMMTKVKKLFLERAHSFGVVNDDVAIEVFDNIQKSQRYSFNASHSYAYAMNTYSSAHWKTHFPLYFFCSYLFWAKEKQDPAKEIRSLVNDAKYFGIEVLPPKFVDLKTNFSQDGIRVTFGLADVKGVGDKAVDKIRGAVRTLEGQIGPVVEWSWFDFLRYAALPCGAGILKKMIEVGAMRNIALPRQRLMAELETFLRLTKKEQQEVARIDRPSYKEVASKELVEIEVEEAVYDKVAMKEYRKLRKVFLASLDQKAQMWENATTDADRADILTLTADTEPCKPQPIGTTKVIKQKSVARRDADGDIIYEVLRDPQGDPILVDDAREVKDLTGALEAILERPGAVTKARRDVVASLVKMLRFPTSPLVDTPHWIAKKEEEGLGIALTISNVATAPTGLDANCTIREFITGKDIRGEIVMKVEIQEVYERDIKTGPNAGRKMGRLVVADDTGVLEDVVVFADAWDDNKNLLRREQLVVALCGKRHWNSDDKSFIVEAVGEL